MWPLAIFSVLHRSIVLTLNGNITDDFKPVYRAVLNFRHGWDIYNEHFDYVDPHYLYPPGGTLLMAPFGYLPFTPSRFLFILINTVAILIAWYLLLRMFKFTLASVAAPALLLAMFCTESVTSTLVFTNINGCVLLAEVLFLRWLLDGRVSRQWWAGLVIGLTLTLKPVLGPLLLLPLLNRQWRTLVPAFSVPVVINIAAWPLVSHPMEFFTKTLPYIVWHPGLLQQLHRGQRRVLRFAHLADRVHADPVRPARQSARCGCCTATTAPATRCSGSPARRGCCCCVRGWCSPLAQGYYSMMLFPFLMTVVLQNSLIRNWPAWLGIYGFMTLDDWLIYRAMRYGRALHYLKITYGWSLLLIVAFTVLLFRYLDAKAENRLDEGIDPAWLTAEPRRASVDA